MFTTLASIVAALTLVLPGFLVVQLAEAGRAKRSTESDWSLVLRSLFYSLLIHIAAIAWTASLAQKLQDGDWEDHVSAVALYASSVVLVIPTVVGLLIRARLVRAERQGQLTLADYAIGGHDARDAWDFLFTSASARGARLIVQLKGADQANPRLLGGTYGERSAASTSPARTHSLYLEDVYAVDIFGNPVWHFDPPRGLWIAEDQIDSLYVLERWG